VPPRISAEFASNDLLHIEVEIFGLTEEQISLVADKIGQGSERFTTRTGTGSLSTSG